MNELKDFAEFVLKVIRGEGVDEADLIIIESKSHHVKIRRGKIEELRFSNPKGIGLRIIKGKKCGVTFSNDFSKEKVKGQILKMIDMLEYMSEDSYVGLPDGELIGRSTREINTYDRLIEVIPTEDKIRMVRELEEEGFKYSPLIKNSEGAQWSDSVSNIVIGSTKGFVDGYSTTNYSMSLVLVAERSGSRQTDYWYTKSRFYKNLESIGSVAKKAAERAIRKLGAKKPKTSQVPVVFDPDVATDLIGIVATCVLGSRVFMKGSFLADKLGEVIGTDKVQLIDDPLLHAGLGSRPFDDEGVVSRKNVIVEDGVLRSYLCDSYSARKLNHPLTGSAVRSIGSVPSSGITNFYLEKGDVRKEDIIASVENGLYLTHVHWTGVNYVTGDYSRGAEGIWIENGKLSYPVHEFTVSGNVLDMLQNIKMVGSDLEFRDNISSPTILVDGLIVSGS